MKLDFISIQATYSHVQIALFQHSTPCQIISHQDAKASSHLIVHAIDLLKQHNLTLSDLAFIAIDKGPGAFTSLRVAIATINGIAFGNKIPLVGIDSLEAITYETIKHVKSSCFIVALLNAYNNDVYYQISAVTSAQSAPVILEKGCKKIDLVLEKINNLCPEQPVIFVGNGFQLHQEIITNFFGNRITQAIPELSVPSAETIGILALEAFKKQKEHAYKIEPNYIKEQTFAIKGQ